jgi:hypothetical protein
LNDYLFYHQFYFILLFKNLHIVVSSVLYSHFALEFICFVLGLNIGKSELLLLVMNFFNLIYYCNFELLCAIINSSVPFVLSWFFGCQTLITFEPFNLWYLIFSWEGKNKKNPWESRSGSCFRYGKVLGTHNDYSIL